MTPAVIGAPELLAHGGYSGIPVTDTFHVTFRMRKCKKVRGCSNSTRFEQGLRSASANQHGVIVTGKRQRSEASVETKVDSNSTS